VAWCARREGRDSGRNVFRRDERDSFMPSADRGENVLCLGYALGDEIVRALYRFVGKHHATRTLRERCEPQLFAECGQRGDVEAACDGWQGAIIIAAARRGRFRFA
jgi:hypothetical protein